MTDYRTVGLVHLFIAALSVLVPLAGAVVAGTFLRRRGRNARLAMIGCLVTAPGPVVLVLGTGFGLDTVFAGADPLVALTVVSGIATLFHLAGFVLILAGALGAPAAPAALQAPYPYAAPFHVYPTDAPPGPQGH
ncbi:hypothetical protein SAMN05216371_6819 [Streptomyces sp. TLI_053]|uniref:hypothetical protein n=1 Tax=Streptomyces sp. TLI_053 TaxID=1855352 RepID=UPI00087C0DEC|nr:hypothetical protein [Streptomyces sp. TLI_053]SDT81783.1 hypothetical protein SAMN05216371_6819 [Streptomyces sp. TLI_053]